MSLDRFFTAQDRIWPAPLSEVQAGRKTSHWMWFVFPQLTTLGRSETARFYGIADAAEAASYLAHTVLSLRLEQMSRAMLLHQGTGPEQVLGSIDALKLRSSMTLFDAVPDAPPLFSEVIDTFYQGEWCTMTLDALSARS